MGDLDNATELMERPTPQVRHTVNAEVESKRPEEAVDETAGCDETEEQHKPLMATKPGDKTSTRGGANVENAEEGIGGAGGSERSTEQKTPENAEEFPSLTKEELEQFKKDPFWRRLRLFLFILFWVVWIAMLTAVIVIIVVSPKCPPRPPRQFWQKPIYRLSVRSFAPASNSDPNSKGSISGLAKRIGYLRNTLGFNNFLLDSLVSKNNITGCAENFNAPNAGLMDVESLKALTKLGRKKGFSFLMELDASQADINWWAEGGEKRFHSEASPLSSRYGNQAAWRLKRVHLPKSNCPSLNVSSLHVRENIQAALSYWLDAGISGFLLNNVAFMAPLGGDSNASSASNISNADWFAGDPSALLYSNASVEFVRSMRHHLNAEAEKRGRELALIVAPGDTGFPVPESKLAAYVHPKEAAHAVLSSVLGTSLDSKAQTDPRSIRQLIEVTQNAVQSNGGSVLFASAGADLRRPNGSYLTALSLLLPGVPNLYYGQELGMTHVESRLGSQTPMQWSDSPVNAGWLANATAPLTWVDLKPRRRDIELHNLRRLSAAGNPAGQLQLVQSLLNLVDSTESLQWGKIAFLDAANTKVDESLLAFKREAIRFPPVFVVVNTDSKSATVSLMGDGAEVVKGTLKVLNVGDGGSSSYAVGEDYPLDRVYAPPQSVLVFLGKTGEEK